MDTVIPGTEDELRLEHEYFWNWFKRYKKSLRQAGTSKETIQKGFIDKLNSRLKKIHFAIFVLVGEDEGELFEIIFTSHGNVRSFAFIEELVAAAPILSGWKFTCLKPSFGFEELKVTVNEIIFNKEKLKFYENRLPAYPDRIEITVTHGDLTEQNRTVIQAGAKAYIENCLGELKAANVIDRVNVIAPGEAEQDLIPIEKLEQYLNWRQKEFIEKYEGTWYDSDTDEHICVESEGPDGKMTLAMVNSNLLKWDMKQSHPWVGSFIIKYKDHNNTGMPSETDMKLLDLFEEKILRSRLKDSDGCVNIGRQTGNTLHELFYVCKDFRHISRVFFFAYLNYSHIHTLSYSIYKDKYWRKLEAFPGYDL